MLTSAPCSVLAVPLLAFVSSQRMTLQLDIGENAQDYSEIAKQEHLSGQTTKHDSLARGD